MTNYGAGPQVAHMWPVKLLRFVAGCSLHESNNVHVGVGWLFKVFLTTIGMQTTLSASMVWGTQPKTSGRRRWQERRLGFGLVQQGAVPILSGEAWKSIVILSKYPQQASNICTLTHIEKQLRLWWHLIQCQRGHKPQFGPFLLAELILSNLSSLFSPNICDWWSQLMHIQSLAIPCKLKTTFTFPKI